MRPKFEAQLKYFGADKHQLNIILSAPQGVPITKYTRMLAAVMQGSVVRTPSKHVPKEQYHYAMATEHNDKGEVFMYHAHTLAECQYRFEKRNMQYGVKVAERCCVDEVQISAAASLECGTITDAEFSLLQSMERNNLKCQSVAYPQEFSLYVGLEPRTVGYQREVVEFSSALMPVRTYYSIVLEMLHALYDRSEFSRTHYTMLVYIPELEAPTDDQIMYLAYHIMLRVNHLRDEKLWGHKTKKMRAVKLAAPEAAIHAVTSMPHSGRKPPPTVAPPVVIEPMVSSPSSMSLSSTSPLSVSSEPRSTFLGERVASPAPASPRPPLLPSPEMGDSSGEAVRSRRHFVEYSDDARSRRYITDSSHPHSAPSSMIARSASPDSGMTAASAAAYPPVTRQSTLVSVDLQGPAPRAAGRISGKDLQMGRDFTAEKLRASQHAENQRAEADRRAPQRSQMPTQLVEDKLASFGLTPGGGRRK